MAQPNSSARFTVGYLPISGSWVSKWKALRILLLISVVLTVLLNPGSLTSVKRLAITFAITFAYSGGLWFVNGYAVDWLNSRVSWAERPLRRLLLTVATAVGGSVAVILLIQAAFLTLMGDSLALLWSPRMYGQVLVPLAITIIISLFNHSRSFFMSWRAAAVRAERLEKETAIARLDSLRRQVDPHFLFNSLNALTSLVEENDPARAVRFIRQLSQVYRYVLDSESQELVPLADEVRFAESYLYLQKTRLGDALAVEMDLPPAAVSPFFVPPLALQLLLENVIKHNTAFQADPLRVRVTIDVAAHTLTVRNTRRPRRLAPEEKSGLGLKNLAARYSFLTSKPLVVSEEAGEFVVTLPLLTL
ncbi:histidine kinase [Hymenobacter sp. BT770]|uniref:sensor histidine kinase n=1 Tax=Hymenobacter sp. BT770 TaxID=2886942 RepID=UPI001D10E3F3|nr:histidine kinase [Hymenobacter sp. BT770]MCC3154629.1 histidine kinase [Hymenobacter sp. BT770]MDO3416682.1 histidine kinase [Hymenobacter sp. BT770]